MNIQQTLKAGPLKLLLVDAEAVEHNRHRAPHKTAPVGQIVVVDGEGQLVSVHSCHRFEVKGDVRLAYEPRGRLTAHRSYPIHAAVVTNDAVVLYDRAVDGPRPVAAPVKRTLKRGKAPTTPTTEQ